nr:hypothetical protein [Tanacetum cinerariifolium]
SCSDVVAFACVILSLLLEVCPIVNALAGRLLGAYDLRVATPTVVVYADDKTSKDARSGGGRTGGRSGDQVNGRIDGQGGQVGDQGNQGRGQGSGKSQNDDAINDNIWGDVRNVIENNDHMGCTYKEFLACNPKEYDGKGGFNMVEFSYSHISREVAVSMSWDNFKELMREEFCPSNEMRKLENELWNHAMVGIRGMVAATEPLTIQKAMQIGGTLTDEALRNGSIKKNPKKRGNKGEPSKDRKRRDDNKRTMIGNSFATIANPVRREYTGMAPKGTTCNFHHSPKTPCRTCFNCNCPRHFGKNCRVVPKNVNPVNARNLTARACYECGSTNHVKAACPRHRTSYLRFNYEIKIASGELVKIDKVIKGRKLEIKGNVFDMNLIPFRSRSFDVIIGMDWLSNHKSEIVCHEKVVRIPLPNDKVLRVIGERPEEKMRHLRSAKTKEQKQEEIVVVRDYKEVLLNDLSRLTPNREIEFCIELVPGAILVAKSPYRLAPSEMKELSGQLKELQDKGSGIWSIRRIQSLGYGVSETQIRRIFLDGYGVSDVIIFLGHLINGDGILVGPSKIKAVKNWEALKTSFEVCSFLELAGCYYRFIKNFSKIAKPLTILTQKSLDEMIKHRSDGALYYLDRIWVPLKGDVRTLIMDEAHKLKYFVHLGADKMYYDLRDRYCWPRMKKNIASMQEALGTRLDISTDYYPQTDGLSERTVQTLEDMLRACVLDFEGSWDVHLPLAEFGEGQLIGHELVQETTKKISQIKDRLKAARDRHKSYTDKRRKPLEFSVGLVAYILRLPEELNGVHDMFHVSNLKKWLVDPTLQVPLDEIQVDAKLNFMEELVEILEREYKKLKRSKISIVKGTLFILKFPLPFLGIVAGDKGYQEGGMPGKFVMELRVSRGLGYRVSGNHGYKINSILNFGVRDGRFVELSLLVPEVKKGSTSGIRACDLRNFDLEELFTQQEKMELETTQTSTAAKLPMLKQENGNSFVLVTQTTTVEGGVITTTILSPVTAEEKIKKNNNVKARSMLLIALPNEHLMAFNQYKDAKILFAAIKTRFGVNEATKKTQKTLLKQIYEKFSAPSTESIDSIFNRLQKINTHVVVWRNKIDLETMSIDDLYNNFKIVEQKVKVTATSNSSSQNIAFVSSSSTNSTNEVYTAYGVSTASTQSSTASTQLVHEDLEQIHEDDLEEMDLKWQLALLSMRVKRECKGSRNQDSRNRFQDSSRRTMHVEETPPKAMVAIDGVGFDWSYMAEDEPQFESYGLKSYEIESKNASEDIPNELKEYPDAPLVKDMVSDNKYCSVKSLVVVEKKTVVLTIAKVKLVLFVEVLNMWRLTAITIKGNGWPKAVNTARLKVVNTARPRLTVVNAVRANQIQVSDGLGPRRKLISLFYVQSHPQKEFGEGYVIFRGGANGGRITCKGTIKTDNLDFKDVYFVKELKFNLFSVLQMALVVKPHNKTPYELFRGRTPTLSFMRPFRYHVTILSTLDHLGKFDGKSDKGYFVGYSMNSKAFRVYNIRTRRVEENLHIEFLKNKPIVADAGPEWLFDIDMLTKSMNYVPVIVGTNSSDFAGTKDSINAGQFSMEIGSTQDYIFMPLWKDGSPLFDSSPKISGDAEKKHDEVLDKESGASNELNSVFENLNTEYPDDPKMPGLVTIATYDGSEEEADFTNLESSIHVSPTPTTRTHKNHPLKQRDVKSAFLYRRIEKEVYVYQPTGFEDLDHHDKVYKVVKALYGLHQAPRA